MSECVVRMEMPKACWACGLRFVCKAAYDFMTRKDLVGCSVLKVGMEGCLIVCQLPEGHGRLVDADALLEQHRESVFTKVTDFTEGQRSVVANIKNAPTIVPAERSET